MERWEMLKNDSCHKCVGNLKVLSQRSSWICMLVSNVYQSIKCDTFLNSYNLLLTIFDCLNSGLMFV